MNAYAVVSASPSAWWGVSAGWPSPRASRASDSPAGRRRRARAATARPSASVSASAGSRTRRRRSSRPRKRALDHRGVEHRHPAGQRVRAADRSPRPAVGAPARSAERSLWIEHRGVLGGLARAHQRVHRLAREPPGRPRTGTAPMAMISSGAGPARSARGRPRTSRPRATACPAAGQRAALKRAAAPWRRVGSLTGAAPAVTALTARNTSRRCPRVSGLIAAGSSRSSGSRPGRQLLELMDDPQLAARARTPRPASRLISMPSTPAAPPPAVARASSPRRCPATAAAQRASAAIGTIAASADVEPVAAPSVEAQHRCPRRNRSAGYG